MIWLLCYYSVLYVVYSSYIVSSYYVYALFVGLCAILKQRVFLYYFVYIVVMCKC